MFSIKLLIVHNQITCKLSLAKSCTDLKIDLRDLKERELIIYNFSIMVMMCIVP